MGGSRDWWWQLRSRSAQECAASWSRMVCICCDPWRWIGCYMGRCKIRRWQLHSPSSAQKCEGGWSYTIRICCDPGRWICRYLGWSNIWWWQLHSTRSANECAADSSHRLRLWWWQLRSPGRWINHLQRARNVQQVQWLQARHLLPSFQMATLWHGAIHSWVVVWLGRLHKRTPSWWGLCLSRCEPRRCSVENCACVTLWFLSDLMCSHVFSGGLERIVNT